MAHVFPPFLSIPLSDNCRNSDRMCCSRTHLKRPMSFLEGIHEMYDLGALECCLALPLLLSVSDVLFGRLRPFFFKGSSFCRVPPKKDSNLHDDFLHQQDLEDFENQFKSEHHAYAYVREWEERELQRRQKAELLAAQEEANETTKMISMNKIEFLQYLHKTGVVPLEIKVWPQVRKYTINCDAQSIKRRRKPRSDAALLR